MTTNKKDYKIITLDDFINLLKENAFTDAGRIRMKPLAGGSGNGFSIKESKFSDNLKAAINNNPALP